VRLRQLMKKGFRHDEDAMATAIAFLMTFTLSIFFMLSITYAVKDNPMEQSKELSLYEYELMAGDIALSVEDMALAVERNPNMEMSKEITIHHNIKTIEYTINVTNQRVRLDSQYEDISVVKEIRSSESVEVKGEIGSASKYAILHYDPDTRIIELRDFR
jgi:hypothetical protein